MRCFQYSHPIFLKSSTDYPKYLSITIHKRPLDSDVSILKQLSLFFKSFHLQMREVVMLICSTRLSIERSYLDLAWHGVVQYIFRYLLSFSSFVIVFKSDESRIPVKAVSDNPIFETKYHLNSKKLVMQTNISIS